MKLKNTFTISRSNTGWQRSKGFNPLFVLLVLVVAIFLLYVLYSVRTSQFFSTRGRITIGVYDEIPYVFSYDKKANLGTIVYFNPSVLVEVPGGYGWYKLGSVRLLAAIEHKTTGLLEKTFARLVGVPVDMVIYKTSTSIVEESTTDFLSYFMQKRNSQTSFSKEFATSSTNIIDRFLINKALTISPDRLIVVNAQKDYIYKDGKSYYTEQKLDSHIKGYLYQKKLTDSGVKVRVIANDKAYKGATLIERLIEGMGTKVLSIDSDNTQTAVVCSILYDPASSAVAKLFGMYFPCKMVQNTRGENRVINFYMGSNLATLYL